MRDYIKILVANEDESIRKALTRALHQRYLGVVVREATSCSEATGAMISGKFDCVLLDENLQDGDGVSCLLDVRKAGITTPVILLSESGANIEALEKNNAGATIALPKNDLSLSLLESCLSSALRFHRSEQQIREVQEELRLRDRAIAAASNGIVICDPHQPDCPIIYCNPAFTAITGYAREETLGRNCRFLQGQDTDDIYVQQMRDAIRDEREFHVILKNYRKNGEPFWNELTISPVRDSEGKLTHFIGIQTDITERKNAEEALLRHVKHQQKVLHDVFRNVTEGRLRLCATADDLPAPLTPFGAPVSLTVGNGVRTLRKQTIKACSEAGISDERSDDLELAVGECAKNTLVHAAFGVGSVFLATSDEHGTVQVKISDEGKGISVADLPNATLLRGFSTAGTMGQGIKMMLKLADRVYLLTGNGGTTVVLEQDRIMAASI